MSKYREVVIMRTIQSNVVRMRMDVMIGDTWVSRLLYTLRPCSVMDNVRKSKVAAMTHFLMFIHVRHMRRLFFHDQSRLIE